MTNGAMSNDERSSSPDEREAEERERRAVEAATAEDLGDGVRRDVHGETVPDPYPDADEDEDTGDEVIERHRREAAAIEHHGGNEPETSEDVLSNDDD